MHAKVLIICAIVWDEKQDDFFNKAIKNFKGASEEDEKKKEASKIVENKKG